VARFFSFKERIKSSPAQSGQPFKQCRRATITFFPPSSVRAVRIDSLFKSHFREPQCFGVRDQKSPQIILPRDFSFFNFEQRELKSSPVPFKRVNNFGVCEEANEILSNHLELVRPKTFSPSSHLRTVPLRRFFSQGLRRYWVPKGS